LSGRQLVILRVSQPTSQLFSQSVILLVLQSDGQFCSSSLKPVCNSARQPVISLVRQSVRKLVC